jgi:guanylate kinase
MLSVSATTRRPRPGEAEGRDYRFVSDEEFDRLVREGAFLEWADVFGHRYGTLAAPISKALAKGRDSVLEIDVQGAAKLKESGLPAMFVFLVPPSGAELAHRLRNRDTESDADVARRLAGAEQEMEAATWFDHVVVNDDVDRAAADLAAIIAGTPLEPPGASRPPIPPAGSKPDPAGGEGKETDS